jgi:hypothetical protein
VNVKFEAIDAFHHASLTCNDGVQAAITGAPGTAAQFDPADIT